MQETLDLRLLAGQRLPRIRLGFFYPSLNQTNLRELVRANDLVMVMVPVSGTDSDQQTIAATEWFDRLIAQFGRRLVNSDRVAVTGIPEADFKPEAMEAEYSRMLA